MSLRILRGRILHCALTLALFPLSVFAQDLRVTTSVTDRSQPDRPRVLSSSLTLFHAGQVYDYMVELGEVVIYEPQAHRFVVLNKDFAVTEVSFAEVARFLDVAKTESQNYLNQLRLENTPQANQHARLVQFQFQPRFNEEFDARSGTLRMSSDALSYQVKTDKSPAPEAVRRYLEYADWTARLNYVLHPNATFPSPRLLLNEALRQQERLPTQVELTLHGEPAVKLQAEHTYMWELKPSDRNLLSHWESQLNARQAQKMTFAQYQQRVLGATADKTARK